MPHSTSSSPLVSIVIPTYNRAHCIARTINSVIEQSTTDWELVIIDNNSTDSTLEIISSFSDERISTSQIENNGIVAASRNLGIRLSRGKYVAFLDSDDWWVPEKLEIALRQLESGSDLVYHDLYKISKLPVVAKKHLRVATRVLSCPVFIDLLTNGNAITNSSVVVRRSFLEEISGFSEEKDLLGSEDFDGWMRISKLTDKFDKLAPILGYYWSGGGNLTSAKTALSNNLFLSHRYKKELNNILGEKLPGWMLYSLARASVALGKYTDGRKYASLSVRSKLPKSIKVKAGIVWLMSLVKFRG